MAKNSKSKVFESLISHVESTNLTFTEPQSFNSYLEKNGLNPKSFNTAEYLSPQCLNGTKGLKKELLDANLMIFRLGNREKDSSGTYFSLIKLKEEGLWSEYFLNDKDIFKSVEPELFIPNVSIRQLFAFNLLSKLTENSLINLAVSSGLLSSALNIESSESLAAPASGNGTFTFKFQASPESPVWTHQNGQVEIDALFVGKRNGKETLFVIEAKTSDKFDSLPKHKLVYPVLAISSKVPGSIPIVPVYIRAVKKSGRREVDFYIAVCDAIDPKKSSVVVSNLEVAESKHLILLGFNEEESFYGNDFDQV